MANINGDVQKRVTLTKDVETIVAFASDARNIELQTIGGNVTFKINGPIANIDDVTANVLSDTFNTLETEPITALHLLTDADSVTVQWDTY